MELQEKWLDKLAKQLGKQTGELGLEDALQEAIDAVRSYCHIEEIPEALGSTVVRMAREIWRGAGYGQEEAPKEVTSISRGDVSTSFAFAEKERGAQFVGEYAAFLNPYRKLGW